MTKTVWRLLLILLVSATGPVLLGQRASAKDPPSGVFYLLEPHRVDHPLRGLAKRRGWANPNVDGVVPRTNWSVLEPAEGNFDWSYYDDALALAKRSNKRLGLSVVAGTLTPAWVYKAGAARFDFILHTNYKEDQRETMPPAWDKVFQEKWGQFIHALGKRYDNSPHVAYVMISGPGFAIETYFVKTPEDIAKFRAAGGAARWLEGSKKIVDQYADAFPNTPFILAMAPPMPNKEGQAAIRELAHYGLTRYPGRFGVMHHGLNATSTSRFFLNEIIQANSGKSPAGFQMVWSMRGENAKRVKGTLREALDRAVEMKAHWVEVYAFDCDEPANGRDLEQIRSRLKAQTLRAAQH
jgi:hypothetical protein